MPAPKGHVGVEVLMWRRCSDVVYVMYFTPEDKDLVRPCPAKLLASELQKVKEAGVS